MLVSKGIVGSWQEGLTAGDTISMGSYTYSPTDVVWLHFKNIVSNINLGYEALATGYLSYDTSDKFAGPFAASAVPVHVIGGTADVLVVIGSKAFG